MSTNPPPGFTGSRQLQVADNANALSFPVLVQYPTQIPSTPTAFGPYLMDVSSDAVVSEGRYPLAIISHGNSGSHLIYRTISMHLARHGYIVAMPEHYGNNRNNNTLGDKVENLQYRPRHISLTIDALLTDDAIGQHIDTEKIAVIGHSFGGYTALAVAGGNPWFHPGQPITVEHDTRVKALVLMAPATGWFMPAGSLASVGVPILLLVAEHDPFTPAWNADVVVNGVPDPSQVTVRVIKNGGHFSFISPFPPTLQNPNFPPSTDPAGFDREKFHAQLPADILEFLDTSW